MTEAQRYKAISDMLDAYTAKHTVSPEAARKALIREGIYTPKGNLKKKYDESLDLKQVAI
ncbi:MAG: hypothetical protein IPN84_14600 [Sphingomonadales bacterium]|jgi:hypothetical protein|nr:hypothetical protein [Sphingomonadales bacterium]